MVNSTSKTRRIIFFALSVFLCSCTSSRQNIKAEKKDCQQLMGIVEKYLFYSCPISKSPNEVILYLDKLNGFVRNKEYDFGNGSIRWNARNAKYHDSNLIDEKSLFLINYTIEKGKESKYILFQAIYYFESEEEKDLYYNKILVVLNTELQLKQETKYDLLNNVYLRYYIPCKSRINIKQSGKRKDKYFIDILWTPIE